MEKLKEVENVAATRLRKTFQYPTESDDDDAVEAGMDEQDQAHLISTLSTRDTSNTHTYTLLLLILPLAPILLYIPRLFSISTLLPSIIAIASLFASAYTLYFLPLPPQEVELIDSSTPKPGTTSTKTNQGSYGYKVPPWEKPTAKPGRRPVPYISQELQDLLAQYMVMVNRALCGILAFYEVYLQREWSEGLSIGGGFLPGLVCLVVLWARTELRIIDMDALEKLKGKGQIQGQAKSR